VKDVLAKSHDGSSTTMHKELDHDDNGLLQESDLEVLTADVETRSRLFKLIDVNNDLHIAPSEWRAFHNEL
jgi:hypothetical protein